MKETLFDNEVEIADDVFIIKTDDALKPKEPPRLAKLVIRPEHDVVVKIGEQAAFSFQPLVRAEVSSFEALAEVRIVTKDEPAPGRGNPHSIAEVQGLPGAAAKDPLDSLNKKSMKVFKDLAGGTPKFLKPHDEIYSVPNAVFGTVKCIAIAERVRIDSQPPHEVILGLRRSMRGPQRDTVQGLLEMADRCHRDRVDRISASIANVSPTSPLACKTVWHQSAGSVAP